MNIPFTLALSPRRLCCLVRQFQGKHHLQLILILSRSPPHGHTYFGGFAYSLKVSSFSALIANSVLRWALLTIMGRCMPASITHWWAGNSLCVMAPLHLGVLSFHLSHRGRHQLALLASSRLLGLRAAA